jgi:hypothetical protein
MPVHLLIVGQVDDPEFAGVGDFLGQLPHAVVEHSPDLAARRAAAIEPGAASPDLIVVLQRHPDEHSSIEIRRLIETYPLARILCGYGPWSESAARTRAAWPSATWVPVALLREHVLAELQVIRGERKPLAITADRADVFEQRYRSESSAGKSSLASLKVAVDVPDAEYRSMLEDELALQSAELVDAREPWDLLLFDAHPEPYRLRELQRLLAASTLAAGRIIILHELPDAAARETWSREALATQLQVQVISKLAPLGAIL